MRTHFRGPEWETGYVRPTPPPIPDAADFARLRLGIDLDPKQEEVLRRIGNRVILNCSRQWGKSTVAAAKAVHRAFTVPGTEVLVATPGDRQSSEFVRKAAVMVRKLGLRAVGDGDNPASLLFPNGSRIVGLPANDATIRGFSNVSLLLIDEAARVPESVYRAVWPMLARSNGDLWLMSTPNGKQGFFYDVWSAGAPGKAGVDGGGVDGGGADGGGADGGGVDGGGVDGGGVDGGGVDGWMRVSIPATDCPRISPAFLEEVRRELGSSFGQEFMCEFASYGAGAFDRDVVERAIDELEEAWEFEPIWKG